MTRTRSLALLFGGCMLLGVTAGARRVDAAPIPFGSNYYEFIQVVFDFDSQAAFNANSFALAAAAATAMSFGGVSGQIATVANAAEDAFLFNLTTSFGFTGFRGAWLVPANLVVYQNWGGIEPNNGGAFAYMSIGTINAPGQWFDDSICGVIGPGDGVPDPQCDPVIGFFVEYVEPNVGAIPEPATLLLLGTGLAAAGVRRRMKKRS